MKKKKNLLTREFHVFTNKPWGLSDYEEHKGSGSFGGKLDIYAQHLIKDICKIIWKKSKGDMSYKEDLAFLIKCFSLPGLILYYLLILVLGGGIIFFITLWIVY